MSQHSGSIAALSDHPASPALLTSRGPQRAIAFNQKLLDAVTITLKEQKSKKSNLEDKIVFQAEMFQNNSVTSHFLSSAL